MSRNRLASWCAFAGIALAGGAARAAPLDAYTDVDASADLAQPDSNTRLRIGPPSALSVGLGAYGGILNQWVASESRAHALGGGELYFRYHYVQAGGFLELTDSGHASGLLEEPQEGSRTVGGLLGVWLPIEGSIDAQACLGYGARRYYNPSEIYGPSGLSLSTQVLELRLGISDRTTARLFGARVGAWLVGTADLDPRAATWRRTFLRTDGSAGETTGTTRIGGISIGLVISASLEVGGS